MLVVTGVTAVAAEAVDAADTLGTTPACVVDVAADAVVGVLLELPPHAVRTSAIVSTKVAASMSRFTSSPVPGLRSRKNMRGAISVAPRIHWRGAHGNLVVNRSPSAATAAANDSTPPPPPPPLPDDVMLTSM